jgi:L-lactate dehydrogenase complex protein LldF
MKESDIFLKDSEKKAFDMKHRQTINHNIGKYNQAVQRGLLNFDDHELARERAAYIKTQTIEKLDQYLLEFEKNFTKKGGKVIWASDTQEALLEIDKILQKYQTKSIVKSKSMTTEEIGLNEFLEQKNIEAIETDLGEYIVQLAHQKPYHIVTPAMHLRKEDVAKIFNEKLGTPLTDDAQVLTMVCRNNLRKKYLSAEIGFTGANFLIADIGGVAITENEGNARLSTTFPKVHIAIVGIEKIIPTLEDLDLFWTMLATSGTGQRLTVYNTIFSGAKQKGEIDGPEEMYVVLLDNGRTDLLEDEKKRQSLNCIRCGACLNVCPVYKNIGGHSYQTTYSGPIGSVISPHLKGMKEYKHLSYASSLCGACGTVCPVKIDLPQLLLLNRQESVETNLQPTTEKWTMNIWQMLMQKRTRIDTFSSRLKNFAFQQLFKKTWGKRRTIPKIANQSFHQWWKENRK